MWTHEKMSTGCYDECTGEERHSIDEFKNDCEDFCGSGSGSGSGSGEGDKASTKPRLRATRAPTSQPTKEPTAAPTTPPSSLVSAAPPSAAARRPRPRPPAASRGRAAPPAPRTRPCPRRPPPSPPRAPPACVQGPPSIPARARGRRPLGPKLRAGAVERGRSAQSAGAGAEAARRAGAAQAGSRGSRCRRAARGGPHPRTAHVARVLVAVGPVHLPRLRLQVVELCARALLLPRLARLLLRLLLSRDAALLLDDLRRRPLVAGECGEPRHDVETSVMCWLLANALDELTAEVVASIEPCRLFVSS